MNNKLTYILEIVWLVAAILSLIAGVHKTIYLGINGSYFLFIITFISVIMYLGRRNLRKNKLSKDQINSDE